MNLKSLIVGMSLMLGSFSFGQDTVYFNFNGGSQQFTVPACINGDIEIHVAGATGGSNANYPNSGGPGALLTGTLPVSAGDVLDMEIGGQGTCGTNSGGFPTGGTGFPASGNYASCGGGGHTTVSLNGTPTIIAGAGGGAGGGGTSTSYTVNGGGGGCLTGQVGSWNNTWAPGNSPFADGGGGGTQVGPGIGGQPWAGVPPGGSPGIGQTGGMGGNWNTASGGGGGGGYFGGGGGGNDGCCTGANAGGGGGGGSSFWPAATIGCTQGGAVPGDGYIMIVLPVCETTICEGDTAFIDFAPQFPPGATNFTVTPGGMSYQAAPGDPMIGLHPTDSTVFDITAMVGGVPQVVTWPVHVVPQIEPDAGLDDSLCFDPVAGAQLQATLHNDGVYSWSTGTHVTFSGNPGTATLDPSGLVLDPTATVDMPGYYEYILEEEDTLGVCPNGFDTVYVYYSEEYFDTAYVHPSCFGYTDGSITLTSDNSGNLGAAQYSIDGGATWQASGTFTNLPSGVYDCVSEDYLGCQYTETITLVDPPQIVLGLTSSDTIICQNGTASQAAYATPAGGIYDFFWSAGTNFNLPTNTVTPSPAGTDMSVDVYAVSDIGCYSDTLTLNIEHHDPITADISLNDTICPGYDTQQEVSNLMGGYQGYTFTWTENGAPYADNDEVINVNPTTNTQYCVTIADACETTPIDLCTEVLMRNVPDVIFEADTLDGCVPTEITFTNLTSNVIIDSVNWYVNGVYYQGPQYNDSLTVTLVDVGEYDATLEVYSIYGCHDVITYTDYISIHDVPSPMFYGNPNPTTIFNTGIELNNATPGINNTFQWDIPGGSPSSSILESPSVYYEEGIVGEYPVTLTVTNEWGCVNSVTSVISVLSDVILYAPNIFTPDGDEFNETWRVHIDGIDIYQFHLTMFNRWGEPVWESYNQISEWNGTYGGGNIVPDGTYVWVIECREKNTDKKHEFRGHVTVLK